MIITDELLKKSFKPCDLNYLCDITENYANEIIRQRVLDLAYCTDIYSWLKMMNTLGNTRPVELDAKYLIFQMISDSYINTSLDMLILKQVETTEELITNIVRLYF